MTSKYPNGFAHNVAIRNVPITVAPSGAASAYWVDSNHGSDGIGSKGTVSAPFATIAHAVTKCTALAGDFIYVAAGHVETVASASGLTTDKAGVTIVFMGEGVNRATINFTSSINASILINGNSVKLVTPRFTTDIDALVAPITITGANPYIVDGEWFDNVGKAATNCIVASSAAVNLKIHGWKYNASTTGTQKATNIQLVAVPNAELIGIDIAGDFSTALVNLPSACSNIRLENLKLNNANVGPLPTMVIHANTTGMAKNVDLRIASGSTYVSNVAKINWDNNCLGYNSNGYSGEPIGTASANSLEGKIDEIVDAIEGAAHDSSAVIPGANGSLMSMVKDIKASITPTTNGYVIVGACDGGMVGSTTTIVAANLGGYGDDYFNDKYYIQVIKNASGVGTAPETQIRKITNYVSTTGTFTVDAFGANVEASDSLMVMHESVVMAGRNDADNVMNTTLVVANANGSLVERDQYNQEAIAAIQSDVGNPSVRANFSSLETMIGIPDTTNSSLDDIVRTGYDSTAIAANANGSLMELLKYLKDHIVPDMSGLAFSGQCDVAMGASATIIDCAGLAGYGNDFFNTKYYMVVIKNANVPGTAPETQIRQITDYVSTTGRFTTNAFGAVVEAADDIMVIYESLVAGTAPIGTSIAAIKAVTDLIPDAGALTTLTGEVTAIKAVTDVIPDAGALTTLSGEVTAIKAVTDVIPDAGALTTLAGEVTAIKAVTDVLPDAGALTTMSGEVTAIKAVTDALPDAGALTALTGDVTAIKAVTDVLPDAGALTTLVGEVTAIKAVTDLLPDAGALTTIAADVTNACDYASELTTTTSSIPAAGSIGRYITSGGTNLGTELGDGCSIVDALGVNGVDSFYNEGSIAGAKGTTFVLSVQRASSTIVQVASNLTSTANGSLLLEDIVCQTDSVGLATGTNVVITCDNSAGAAIVYQETVANLGASSTSSWNSTASTSPPYAIEFGKRLKIESTVADCTGAGYVNIYLKFRRISEGASISTP